MNNFDLKKYLAEGRINLSEAVFKVTQEFEVAEDPNWKDGRDYVAVKDNGKGGEWIVDPNQKKYTPGTLQIIAVLEEQDYEWQNAEDYFADVATMQAFKNIGEAEDYIYDAFGTDYIDELELHRDWEDAMFPRPDKSPFMEDVEDKLNEEEISFDDDIEDNSNKNDFFFWYRSGKRGEQQALKAQELLKQNRIDADFSKGPYYIDFKNANVEQRVAHQILRDAGLTNFVIGNHKD